MLIEQITSFLCAAVLCFAAPPSANAIVPPADVQKISITVGIIEQDANAPSVMQYALTLTNDANQAHNQPVDIKPCNLTDAQVETLNGWLRKQKGVEFAKFAITALDGNDSTLNNNKDIQYVKSYIEPNNVKTPVPVYGKISIGSLVTVHPTIAADKKTIFTLISVQKTKLLQMSKTSYKPGYDIELPQTTANSFQTSLSVPVNTYVLQPADGISKQDKNGQRTTYLLVSAADWKC